MTLREVYRSAILRLEEAGVPDAPFDARQLFAQAMGVGRAELSLHGGEPVDEAALARLEVLLARRAAREPLQYLLGEWEFYGLPFQVGPGVLIPRADTETLVDAAREALTGRKQPRIVDLCSGSGCVACALARTLPDASVTAVDLSEAALPYLRANVKTNAPSVRICHADALDPDFAAGFSELDAITANPPYLTEAEMDALQPEVACEPALALRAGEDGLSFYRALFPLWTRALAAGGIFAVEIGRGQEDAVALLMREAGLANICTNQDLCGIIRVITGARADSSERTDEPHGKEENRYHEENRGCTAKLAGGKAEGAGKCTGAD